MTQIALTKEERFIVALAKEVEGNLEQEADFPSMARRLGFRERMTEGILRVLQQGNFIKRKGDKVTLTKLGFELAEVLA